MREWAGLIVIGIGIVYDLLACVGLIRMPEVYTRLQTATKAVTAGTCFILIGAVIYFGFSAVSAKAILCMFFVLLTNPTAAHAIARGAHSSGVRVERITAYGLLGRRVESELWDRIRPGEKYEKDRFDAMIEFCPIVDIEGHMGCEEFFCRIAPVLGDTLRTDPEEVERRLIEREQEAATALEPDFAIPHILVPGEDAFGIMAARASGGVWFSKECPAVKCIFILGGSRDQWHLYLRSLAAIAQIVQIEGFHEQWLESKDESSLRELLRLASHHRHLAEADNMEHFRN